MHLQCPGCENMLDDDTDCLTRQLMEEDDHRLASLFEDYRVELWQCSHCRQHIIIVEDKSLYPMKTTVFYAEFRVSGKEGYLIREGDRTE